MDVIETIKLILSIGAFVVSILTLCGFGVFMSLHTTKRFKDKEKKKEAEEAARIAANNAALMSLINAALDEKITPIANDVAQIKGNLAQNTEGTVTLLRNDMKKARDYYKDEKHYATTNDKASWMELYNTYSKLGGNHFREYVDGWRRDVMELPTEKPRQRRRLNEGK